MAKITAKERRNKILAILKEQGPCTLTYLKSKVHTSGASGPSIIDNDVKILRDKGIVKTMKIMDARFNPIAFRPGTHGQRILVVILVR